MLLPSLRPRLRGLILATLRLILLLPEQPPQLPAARTVWICCRRLSGTQLPRPQPRCLRSRSLTWVVHLLLPLLLLRMQHLGMVGQRQQLQLLLLLALRRPALLPPRC